MTISENDRLGLRQELERLFNNPRHAETLMRSLPSTENSEIATRGDLERLSVDLRREVDVMGRELRADLKTETAEITRQLAVQFRLTVLMQMGVLLAVISLLAVRN